MTFIYSPQKRNPDETLEEQCKREVIADAVIELRRHVSSYLPTELMSLDEREAAFIRVAEAMDIDPQVVIDRYDERYE